MKNKNIYWKVVREEDGKYYSAVVGKDDVTFGLRYRFDRYTVPNIGKIFVFQTRKDARNWIGNSMDYGYRIFKCKVRNPTVAKSSCFTIDSDSLTRFWRTDRLYFYTEPPVATVFVDAAKLIR